MAATKSRKHTAPEFVAIDPTDEMMSLSREYLRLDREWRDMPRPAPGTPTRDGIAMHNRLTDAWHRSGPILMQLDDIGRNGFPAAPFMAQLRWECDGRTFCYDPAKGRTTVLRQF